MPPMAAARVLDASGHLAGIGLWTKASGYLYMRCQVRVKELGHNAHATSRAVSQLVLRQRTTPLAAKVYHARARTKARCSTNKEMEAASPSFGRLYVEPDNLLAAPREYDRSSQKERIQAVACSSFPLPRGGHQIFTKMLYARP